MFVRTRLLLLLMMEVVHPNFRLENKNASCYLLQTKHSAGIRALGLRSRPPKPISRCGATPSHLSPLTALLNSHSMSYYGHSRSHPCSYGLCCSSKSHTHMWMGIVYTKEARVASSTSKHPFGNKQTNKQTNTESIDLIRSDDQSDQLTKHIS